VKGTSPPLNHFSVILCSAICQRSDSEIRNSPISRSARIPESKGRWPLMNCLGRFGFEVRSGALYQEKANLETAT
jgi:hypothetical protein